jgi:hypothetical protein
MFNDFSRENHGHGGRRFTLQKKKPFLGPDDQLDHLTVAQRPDATKNIPNFDCTRRK